MDREIPIGSFPVEQFDGKSDGFYKFYLKHTLYKQRNYIRKLKEFNKLVESFIVVSSDRLNVESSLILERKRVGGCRYANKNRFFTITIKDGQIILKQSEKWSN